MASGLLGLSLEPDENTLADMARVVIYWSHCEAVINSILCSLLHVPTEYQDMAMYPIRGFTSKRDILFNILKDNPERHGLNQFDVQILNDEITKCYAYRNRIAHRSWIFFVHSAEMSSTNHRPDYKLQKMTKKELTEAVKDCKNLYDLLHQTLIKIDPKTGLLGFLPSPEQLG